MKLSKIKLLDLISNAPRSNKKKYIKSGGDNGDTSDDKTLKLTNVDNFDTDKNEAMQTLGLTEEEFDKLYSGYYDKLYYSDDVLFKTKQSTPTGSISLNYESIKHITSNGDIILDAAIILSLESDYQESYSCNYMEY